MKNVFRILGLMLGVSLLSGMALAQEPLAPDEVTGEVVYIPFPVQITVDGKVDDWAGVPHVTVDRGSMTSSVEGENTSFDFAVAADETNLYLTMSSVDQNIITGQHETSFWNEDSLEFYFDFGWERSQNAYDDNVFQVNINPGDIGNTDPTALTITGTNSANRGIEGFVFETDDGWGFEASIPLPEGFTPEHGTAIGFQAQANGATELDRDVKLIWSLADTADTSWNDPSVFGFGIFYEVGQTAMPETPERPEPSAATPEAAATGPVVSTNQVGYFPDAPKFGVLAGTEESVPWRLLEWQTDIVIAEGMTAPGRFDSASGDTVQIADFSDVMIPGGYFLEINGVRSHPFHIGTDIYNTLPIDSLRYFYLNRSGIELTPEFAKDWARPAGHVTDNAVTCFKGTDADGKEWDGCDYTLDVHTGWYDAGDYGKYVVNGGIATWTLLNSYERVPNAFPDGSANIPESGNGVPDILDEARWEMEFMLGMQVPEGQPLAGMVHHKMHDRHWSGVPVMPAAETDNTDFNNGRFLMPPSTAATLNLAATAAQCARIWREIDADFSARCLTAAETAWQAAVANPAIYAGNTPGEGGGNYDDKNVTDEFFWAAAELFITTGDEAYREYLTPVLSGTNDLSMWWGGTNALGTISLLSAPNTLSDDERETLQQQIITAAAGHLDRIESEGYRVPLSESQYVWGSSSDVLNKAIIMALAYDFTGDAKYLGGVTESMDYLLGRNANGISFVSGYGTNSMQHPHHRFWGNQPANGFPPPPPGAISGGPNGQPSDPTALEQVAENATAKRYIDNIGSYSTNEVAINWNAPLTWVAAYLNDHYQNAKS
jgi:hypothetical protein